VKSFTLDAGFLHLINYTNEPQTVTLNERYENLAAKTTITGKLELKPFGAAILKRN
jgi:beta-galactosidase GanA